MVLRHRFFLRKHSESPNTDSCDVNLQYTSSLSIHKFSSVLESACHGIKRVLKLCAREKLYHIREQAPKKLPSLVDSPLIARLVRRICHRSALISQRAGVAKRHASRKLASSIVGGTWSRTLMRRPRAAVWEGRRILSSSLMISCLWLAHMNQLWARKNHGRAGEERSRTYMGSCTQQWRLSDRWP
jgi:hypothetical protein